MIIILLLIFYIFVTAVVGIVLVEMDSTNHKLLLPEPDGWGDLDVDGILYAMFWPIGITLTLMHYCAKYFVVQPVRLKVREYLNDKD